MLLPHVCAATRAPDDWEVEFRLSTVDSSELFYTDSEKCLGQSRKCRARLMSSLPDRPGRPVRVCVHETPAGVPKNMAGVL